jgi:hypothetical protein
MELERVPVLLRFNLLSDTALSLFPNLTICVKDLELRASSVRLKQGNEAAGTVSTE